VHTLRCTTANVASTAASKLGKWGAVSSASIGNSFKKSSASVACVTPRASDFSMSIKFMPMLRFAPRSTWSVALAPGEPNAKDPLRRLACRLTQNASSSAADVANGARTRAAKLATSRFQLEVTSRWQSFKNVV
jgi:hypothetical protein